MSHNIQDMVQVTPSMLTPWQVMVLNAALHDHGLQHWTPEHVPDFVSYACLRCQSVGVSSDNTSRDMISENYDMQCCGLTVVFHSVLSSIPMEFLYAVASLQAN